MQTTCAHEEIELATLESLMSVSRGGQLMCLLGEHTHVTGKWLEGPVRPMTITIKLTTAVTNDKALKIN